MTFKEFFLTLWKAIRKYVESLPTPTPTPVPTPVPVPTPIPTPTPIPEPTPTPIPVPVPIPTPVPSLDDIDINSITILSPCTTEDIKNWPITSMVTRAYQEGTRVRVEHTKSGKWPLAPVFGNPPSIEGNIGIVAQINGRWYGAGFDWLGEGRTEKILYPEEFGRDQIRIHPLDASWPGPKPGDKVGLFVTTPSSERIGERTVNERSNIKCIIWN